MVSTRIVILIGVAFLFFSIGSGWLEVYTGQTRLIFNVFDIAPHANPILTSASPQSNFSIDGQVWIVLQPLLVSTGPPLAAEWLFPIAFFVSITSFLRWKLMVVAGISGVLSGSLWIFGISLIRANAALQISGVVWI